MLLLAVQTGLRVSELTGLNCGDATLGPSPTPGLVAAIVDRVTFNAHILETGTQSYRLRTSKTTNRRKRTT